jgi:hypothetical protein
MRYVIVPLVIILYIRWSYYGIKEFIKEYKLNKEHEHSNPFFDAVFTSNIFWVEIHTIFIIVFFVVSFIFLCIKFW